MTTVVYDHKNKEIAFDSQVSCGSFVATDSYDKVIRNDIGFWVLAGNICDHLEFAQLSHGEIAPRELSVDAIVIKGGVVYEASLSKSGVCTWTPLSWSDAIGSGASFAVAAIDFGCTAKEAIEYAIKKDSFTGGEVHVFSTKKAEL